MFNVWGIPGWINTGVPNNNPNINNAASRIRNPAEFVFFHEYSMGDVNWGPLEPGVSSVGHWSYGLGGSGNFHDPFFDENPSAVVGFADGHAKRLLNIRGKGRGGDQFGFTLVPRYGTHQN